MQAKVTYAEVFRPCRSFQGVFYDISLIVGGSLLIGLCAQVSIGWPVPVTGQTFAVLMVGALFGARRGSLCVVTYIAEGVAGFPVFSAGRAGLAVLAGPTGGYIAGFIVAAYVTGYLAEKGWDRHIWTTIMAMILGNLAIYAFGLGWLCKIVEFKSVLAIGLYPFIVGDLLKIALAAVLLPGGWKLLEKLNLYEK
ncbi:MAG: biotin transporter BioY [Planctomycetota bacterium]